MPRVPVPDAFDIRQANRLFDERPDQRRTTIEALWALSYEDDQVRWYNYDQGFRRLRDSRWEKKGQIIYPVYYIEDWLTLEPGEYVETMYHLDAVQSEIGRLNRQVRAQDTEVRATLRTFLRVSQSVETDLLTRLGTLNPEEDTSIIRIQELIAAGE